MTQQAEGYATPQYPYGNPTPPPPTPKRRKRGGLIFGLIVLAAFVIGGVALTVHGGNMANQSNAQAAAASGNSPQTTVTVPPAPSLADQEHTWLAGDGGQALLTLKNDLQQFSTDATNGASSGDFSAVLTDCQQMQTDSEASITATANPDPKAASQLAAAYGDIQTAAGECVTGVNDYNAGDMTDATSSIQAASTSMVNANSQIVAATATITGDAS